MVGLREGHDDAAQNYRQARALLARHPDIIGIYNIGGASVGIARALREANRGSTVTFIGHGLTSDTRAALRDGRAAMAGIEPIEISLFVRENLS